MQTEPRNDLGGQLVGDCREYLGRGLHEEDLMPGSPAALWLGCTCDPHANGHGEGAPDLPAELYGDALYWVEPTCPLHGGALDEDDDETGLSLQTIGAVVMGIAVAIVGVLAAVELW